jgi:hypothetical protein
MENIQYAVNAVELAGRGDSVGPVVTLRADFWVVF